MLKAMRRRFVGSAMAAFSAVVLVLLLAVNGWNCKIVADRQDSRLQALLEQTGRPAPGKPGFRFPGLFDSGSPEIRYMLRYFSVQSIDETGEMEVNQENIASVTADEALEYARTVLKRGRESGYYKLYRYLTAETGDGTLVLFLNAEQEFQNMKGLLMVSCIVALISLLAVFVLVLTFSKHAVAPYVKNLETQKRFITDAGHELKTPLTAISASADVLAMEQADNEWVRNIQHQSARMAKLVSNLVTLSRLDEEQPFPERTDFSFSDAVWEISEPFAALAAANGKQFSQHIEDGLTFHGDRSAIQQMVSILLDNAVRYTDDGGEIHLEARRERRHLLLEVRNTCQTQALGDLERLFDRFYRPDKSRSADSGGTGIGLSIVRAVATAHGGTVTARSLREGELVFTVLL